jgi:hypothetical protein
MHVLDFLELSIRTALGLERIERALASSSDHEIPKQPLPYRDREGILTILGGTEQRGRNSLPCLVNFGDQRLPRFETVEEIPRSRSPPGAGRMRTGGVGPAGEWMRAQYTLREVRHFGISQQFLQLLGSIPASIGRQALVEKDQREMEGIVLSGGDFEAQTNLLHVELFHELEISRIAEEETDRLRPAVHDLAISTGTEESQLLTIHQNRDTGLP